MLLLDDTIVLFEKSHEKVAMPVIVGRNIMEKKIEESNGEKVIPNILANYQSLEKSIIAQLNMLQDVHGTTIGSLRESIWQELFERIIPKKFVIEQSVFIIDSNKNVSKEVDLVIMDEMYTPYIFRFGKIKYVPIEAVAVVVECKSNYPCEKDLMKWSKAISKLRTKKDSIARLAFNISMKAPPTQQSTRPIKILCAKKINTEMNHRIVGSIFDFTITVSNENEEKLTIRYSEYKSDNSRTEDKSSLRTWYEKLNFYEVDLNEKDVKNIDGLNEYDLEDYQIPDNPLLSLNFQLNQLLMLINNPMPFPHLAYAEMFSGKKKKGESDE